MIGKTGRYLGLLFSIVLSFQAYSQTFEEFKTQIREEYTSFEKETQQKFNDFVAKIDAEFADHLTRNFGEYTPETLKKEHEAPKPKILPEAPEE